MASSSHSKGRKLYILDFRKKNLNFKNFIILNISKMVEWLDFNESSALLIT